MNVSLLEREAIVPEADDDTELLLGNLDREAHSLLGYSRLRLERVKTRRREALQRTLIDRDIRPFTRASVEAYKKSCEWAAHRRLAETAMWTSAVSILVCFAAMAVLIFAALFWFTSIAFYAALTVLIGTILASACGVIQSRYGRERKWTMKKLSEYTEPVPEFALQTAVDVKQAHPEVEFYVCTLEENRLVVDPFLVLRVRDGHETRDYYLEVWNEADFHGRRLA